MIDMPAFVRRQSNRKSYDFESYYAANSATSISTTPTRSMSFSRRLSLTLSPKDTDVMSHNSSATANEDANASTGEAINVQAAIELLKRLRETASPDELVALHRALLPLNNEAPAMPPTDQSSSTSFFRRSASLTPGIATRRKPLQTSSTQKSTSKRLSKARPNPAAPANSTPSLPCHSQMLLTDLYAPIWPRAPSFGRPTSPAQLSVLALGGHQLGTLRITNGAASPEPSAMSSADCPSHLLAVDRPKTPENINEQSLSIPANEPIWDTNSVEALIAKLPGLDLYADSSDDDSDNEEASPAPAINRHSSLSRRASEASHYSLDSILSTVEDIESEPESRRENQNRALRMLNGDLNALSSPSNKHSLGAQENQTYALPAQVTHVFKEPLETVESVSSAVSVASLLSTSPGQGDLDEVLDDVTPATECSTTLPSFSTYKLAEAESARTVIPEHADSTTVMPVKARTKLQKRPPSSRSQSSGLIKSSSWTELNVNKSDAAIVPQLSQKPCSIGKPVHIHHSPGYNDLAQDNVDRASDLSTVPAIPLDLSVNFSRRMSRASEMPHVDPRSIVPKLPKVEVAPASLQAQPTVLGTDPKERRQVHTSVPVSAVSTASVLPQVTPKPEVEKWRSFFGRLRGKSVSKKDAKKKDTKSSPSMVVEQPETKPSELSAVREQEEDRPKAIDDACTGATTIEVDKGNPLSCNRDVNRHGSDGINKIPDLLSQSSKSGPAMADSPDAALANRIRDSIHGPRAQEIDTPARSRSVPRSNPQFTSGDSNDDRNSFAPNTSRRQRPKSEIFNKGNLPRIYVDDGSHPLPRLLRLDDAHSVGDLSRMPSTVARKPLPGHFDASIPPKPFRTSRAIPWETYHPPSPPLEQGEIFDNTPLSRPKSSATNGQINSRAGSDENLLAPANTRRYTPYQPPTPPNMSRPSSTHDLLDRYSGGLGYGWERGLGFSGSAGMRSKDSVAANRKSLATSQVYGVDLSDVPLMLQRIG